MNRRKSNRSCKLGVLVRIFLIFPVWISYGHEGHFEFHGGTDQEIYSHLVESVKIDSDQTKYESSETLEKNLWKLAEQIILDEGQKSNHVMLEEVILTIGSISDTSDYSKEKLNWVLDHAIERLDAILIEFAGVSQAKERAMEKGLDPFGGAGRNEEMMEFDKLVDFYGAAIVSTANTMGTLGLDSKNPRFQKLASVDDPRISILAMAGPEIVESAYGSGKPKAPSPDLEENGGDAVEGHEVESKAHSPIATGNREMKPESREGDHFGKIILGIALCLTVIGALWWRSKRTRSK